MKMKVLVEKTKEFTRIQKLINSIENEKGKIDGKIQYECPASLYLDPDVTELIKNDIIIIFNNYLKELERQQNELEI